MLNHRSPALKGRITCGVVLVLLGCTRFPSGAAEPAPAASKVQVVDGMVMPKQPVSKAIVEAMQFLKKADGGYVPGKINGELAGYFNSAFVKEDGSRAERQLAYPGRQHAYFIFTFLRYYAYTGEGEWLLRARDLADWNIAHSTPATAIYNNVPYSTFTNGVAGGSQDVDSIEPDKSAFLGSGYIAVYEATGDRKYLEAATQVASTLAKHQRKDGSWPFRVVPETGVIRQDFGGAPVFFVEFFENLLRYHKKPELLSAHSQALKLMIERNIEKNLWGTYHEDIRLKPENYLSAEPMSFTAAYLFRHGNEHPEYVDMGRKVIARMEERLVHTEGHAAAPAPAVAEQAGFDHIMPGHTARYCMALANLYATTGDEQVKRKALSAVNALTFMQSPAGLFRTFFHSVPKRKVGSPLNWYSQHLYTVCHVLELMPSLPEVAPEGEDHILGSDLYLGKPEYSRGQVKFEAPAAARTVLKLSFAPKSVRAGNHEMRQAKELKGQPEGWSFDKSRGTLTIIHPAGQVEVR